MKAKKRAAWLTGALVLVCLPVLAWAWHDAGREPTREIVFPIPTPGGTTAGAVR